MTRTVVKKIFTPRTVAAIDCGSSSIRATVAEITGPTSRRIIETVTRQVDLRHAFQAGRFRRGAMDEIVAALADMLPVLKGYGVGPSDLRAVATSAWREAGNADALLERIADRLGLMVEIVDGGELARLYYEAFLNVLAQEKRSLRGTSVLADIGSGATVVGLISGGKLVQSVEERFGTVRLLADFGNLRESVDFHNAVARYAHGAATMMLKRLGGQARNLVITGTEIRDLRKMLHPGGDGLLDELELASVGAWLDAAREVPLRALASSLQSSEDDAGALVLAGQLFHQLCVVSGHDRALVPQLNLREGILADLMPGALGPHHLPREVLIAAARQHAERYGTNLAYADNTRELAVQIFDQTIALHHLGSRERTLLELAALLHDIGSYVNARSRHKHSFYLIQATDFAGLSRLDKSLVAHIARYHRRSVPAPSHLDYQALPRRERVVVAQLAAILRLAYALDVERTQRIRTVTCTVSGDRLNLRTDRRQIALEQWSMAQRSGMFNDVYGLEVVLLPREG